MENLKKEIDELKEINEKLKRSVIELEKKVFGNITTKEIIGADPPAEPETKDNFEKINTKIIFSTIVEFNNEKLAKEEMEKTILVDIPSKIYPELRQIFVFLFENSGYRDIKINKTVDFEKLYKMKKIQ